MFIPVLSFILFYQQVVNVVGWGPVGHGLVARLAQSQLTSFANSWISEYIPGNLFGDLSRIASWPDLILYSDTNPFDYTHWQWSRELHFINTPDWNCTYISSRDCINDRCIEGALRNYSRRLINYNCGYVEQQEALFFLVHFLGDVHQPLHCGFRSDFGGNNVKGYFLNSTNQTNLHSIWDVEIIDTRIHRHFQSDANLYYDYLQSLMLNQSLLINETADDFPRWIDESIHDVCTQVYFDDNHMKLNPSRTFTLGEDYFNQNWPLVDQRLAQAGRRLSLLINQLSQKRSASKLPPDMQALIITLCTAFVISFIVGIGLYMLGRRNTPDMRPLISDEP